MQLCNTDSPSFFICRPHIYHQVSLKLVRPDLIDATLALLAREFELAKEVTELSICGLVGLPLRSSSVSDTSLVNLEKCCAPFRMSSPIALNAVKNMTQLRSLELAGTLFGSVQSSLLEDKEYAYDWEASKEFCQIVRGMITRGLEELVVRHQSVWEGDAGIGIPSHSVYAALEGPRTIEWVGTDGTFVVRVLARAEYSHQLTKGPVVQKCLQMLLSA